MSVIIVVDGVMRRERDQSPIMQGVALYKSLNETNRVLLLTDNRERTDVWLKLNNLAKKIDDIIEIGHKEDPNPRVRQINSLRSKDKIDFVVTEDPDLARDLIEQGIPVLVFLNPSYTRPEFRPDARAGVKRWESIMEEMDRQQGLYMEDPRL